MTVRYKSKGNPQPIADSGDWFGRLGSFFGVGAPSYEGNGQPSARVRTFGSKAPVYQTTPRCSNTVDPPLADPSVTCPVDPAALAAGQIAIIVPRKGC